ncbi:MAG TPA: tRNA pseudouridine(38-40) synthase TruA [Candidatus Polarisedimenticolia bacterium]|nr:tRNA pseudouridine(38-40) synthase TruA [Candidatus Polarisedimenticolia bacterium]
MPLLKLTVEYAGGAYHGWQIQPGVPTIQGVLQDKLAMILRRPILLRGAARTDAGVHALGQVASTSGPVEADTGRLLRSLNAVLPDDIAVRSIVPAPLGFHARHSAVGRIYRYQVLQGEAIRPFDRPFAAHTRFELDLAAMQSAASRLIGVHDFSSFRGAGDTSESPVKEIRASAVSLAPGRTDLVLYTVEANSFLQYMVRALAGTLLEVGRGRLSPEAVDGILAARNRSAAGPTAPARGLFLVRVLYPDLAPATSG